MSTVPVAPEPGVPASTDAATGVVDDTATRNRSLPTWLDVTLAVLFGLFYAYDVWEVVESIVQLLGLGLSFSGGGWAVMIVALVAPLACFGVAFALGRRRGLLARIALYFTGLAVSAVLFLSLTVLLGQIGGVVV
ncbi:bacitracin resistance protein [Agromyces allii]|uniref:Bacitracin resistance protein n=1 Tax=Agromyces allii TaxID=393607 RepID=A0ABP5BT80_9MICO|nr:bacitracin resistance protein [Agromyces allii]